MPVDRSTLLTSTQLPGAMNGDPVDRILIATAANAGVPLVTADRAIVDYVTKPGRDFGVQRASLKQRP